MKLLREPLLHFAVAGVILFSGYSWFSERQPDAAGLAPVQVGQGEIDWLRQLFQNQWLRPPDTRELKALVTDLVNEELLAREAEAMGLGEDDGIIRRRLAQKLKFLVEDTARLIEPGEAELRAYYETNAARYQPSARLTFTQIYFNPEWRKDPASDANAALARLSDTRSHDIEAAAGDRFLLDTQFADVDEQSVTAIFGPEFSRMVFALEAGEWRGPVKSGYGDHLVFVEAKTPAKNRAFEEVRDRVLEEWRAEQQQAVNRDYVDRLREKYGVIFDDSAKALLRPEHASALATP